MKKTPFKEKLSYSLGSLGNNLIVGLLSTSLVVFYTDYLLLPAFSIAALFFVSKLWDEINDSIMGIIVDNTITKWAIFAITLKTLGYRERAQLKPT